MFNKVLKFTVIISGVIFAISGCILTVIKGRELYLLAKKGIGKAYGYVKDNYIDTKLP